MQHHGRRFPYEIQAAHRRRRLNTAILASIEKISKRSTDLPSILVQAVVTPAAKTTEGQIIEAVAFPWFEIVDLIQKDESAIYQLTWRKWEEIVAGAYKAQGFEVVLTPRSNDRGRDVIATKNDLGEIRFFDQVKAYKPGHLVTADDVRAMVGVLTLNPNVSKGVITTTSDFAPGVLTDQEIQRLVPYRLELKPKDKLLSWLSDVAKGAPQGKKADDA